MHIWKTLKLGSFQNVESIYKTIIKNVFKIGDWAHDILKSDVFVISPTEKEVDIVRVKVRDLGFNEGAYRKDIYQQAIEMGLELCSLEIGPILRLAYKDQPRSESLQIGMEPQKDSGNHESEFRVAHSVDGHLFLVGDHKHPTDFWEADEFFVFVKPRLRLSTK